jgi:hypothetical protein
MPVLLAEYGRRLVDRQLTDEEDKEADEVMDQLKRFHEEMTGRSGWVSFGAYEIMGAAVGRQ